MLRSIISGLGRIAVNSRAALGRAASAVGRRVSSWGSRAGRWVRNVGIAAAGYNAGGGSNNNPNDIDEEFIQNGDYGQNQDRSNQLVALNQPIETGGGYTESQGKGIFDPAITQILKSIDANIRAMRDSINNLTASQNTSRNYTPRASSLSRRQFPGEYALTGLGLLGVAAGQITNPTTPQQGGPTPGQPNTTPPQGTTNATVPVAPQISQATGSTNETLQQNLSLQPAPNNDVLSQPPTAQNRTAHTVDISQLRNSVSETRNRLQENNRNPRQNTVVLRILSNAENNITELERLYNTQNPDMDAITDLRRQILEGIQSARNYINPSVTPQQDNRTLPTPQPEPTPNNDVIPGPQSNLDSNGMETTVNNRMEDYYQTYNNSIEGNRNSYFNYMASAMSNNISVSSQPRDLTGLNIITGNEDDNVAKRLESIQIKNDASPIVIQSGGGESAPTIIQQTPQQQNTPAPSPGTGDINIGYKSHPMLVNEPRSPAFFSYP